MSDLKKTAFYGDLVGVKIGVECRYFSIELLRDMVGTVILYIVKTVTGSYFGYDVIGS